MIEFFINLLGAGFLVSLVLCGLYLVMHWPAETEDFKTQATREELKNRRISQELEARRKGGDE